MNVIMTIFDGKNKDKDNDYASIGELYNDTIGFINPRNVVNDSFDITIFDEKCRYKIPTLFIKADFANWVSDDRFENLDQIYEVIFEHLEKDSGYEKGISMNIHVDAGYIENSLVEDLYEHFVKIPDMDGIETCLDIVKKSNRKYSKLDPRPGFKVIFDLRKAERREVIIDRIKMFYNYLRNNIVEFYDTDENEE